MGFSIYECRQLLTLYEDKKRSSRDVKAIASAKIEEVEQKLQELQTLKAALSYLVDHCRGDERPDCPILDDLAGQSKARTLQ